MKKFILKLLTFYISDKNHRKNTRESLEKKLLFFNINRKYSDNINRIRKKVASKEKIRVMFFVIYDSVFPSKPLFEKMLMDPMFEPFLIVIPDLTRDEDHMHREMKKTFDTLSSIFENVYKSYDTRSKMFTDFSDAFDLVCSSNIYDSITHKYYKHEYLKDKKTISFHINYAYMGRNRYDYNVFKLAEYSYIWKIFVENEILIDEISKNQYVKGRNLVLAGYCKMDNFVKYVKEKSKRKKIILAPHHTVKEWKDGLNLSNFLNYSDFFLELPKLYPEIDFIFRPHPLLFATLREKSLWGDNKVGEYLLEIEKNINMTYSDGGDYLEIFANSDALIHDCGSFLAEYFYTEHPQCYMLRNRDEIEKEFLPFGKQMLSHCYLAFSCSDIINFIEDVVINDHDEKKLEREKFVTQFIKFNYPNVSSTIIEYIKDTFS